MFAKNCVLFNALVCLILVLFPRHSVMAGTFSRQTVQLAWFYKPPRDGNLARLAQHFDTFILTKVDEPVRDELRMRGVTSPFLQYVRFDAIHNPCYGTCPCDKQPYRNQVAWEMGDFCMIRAQHPDWFLRDIQGNEVALSGESQRYIWMDPGHPGWRHFWLQRIRRSQEQRGWDGVFLDNVEASLGKYTRNHVQLALYPDATSLQAAVVGFLHDLYTTYFDPQDRPVLANIIELRKSAVWFDYLRYLDGAMDEAFAVAWHTGYRRVTTWDEHLSRAERTQELGKRIILIAQGKDQSDRQRQQFAFASYLLITQGRASFRYIHSGTYTEAWLYDNYALDLGEPLGPRYPDGVGWRRDFTQGSVRVDPAAHTAEIKVDGAR